jgi:oligosaccharide amylase
MPRPLVIGNGKLLVNFDETLSMRDLYYPFVGELNHIGGHYSRMGVWVNGLFSWCNEQGWEIELGYKDETLVTEVRAVNKKLGVKLVINDAIHQLETIYLKQVKIYNLTDKKKEMRLFFNHDLSINESDVGDTALYDPALKAIYHYKRHVYVLMNGQAGSEGLFQYSLGVKRFNHAEGTWRDAEDGVLEGNPVSQGSVDSTISFRQHINGLGQETVYYWICIGKNYNEIKRLNLYVQENQPQRLIKRVEVYWQHWVNKKEVKAPFLSEEMMRLYKLSLLIIHTQTDSGGAILAANDSDILPFSRDHYSYMWPRDGALVACALSKAGYDGIPNDFFQFCNDALTPDGYLLHKYNPDGSVGSSWHPYYREGEVHLPIQEDETALVLYALWEHYKMHGQIERCQSFYATLIRPAATFLMTYMDNSLQLPHPSYDLWEERRGIFTFTCSAVYAGLVAASQFAYLFGDDERGQQYKQRAELIKQAMIEQLYDPVLKRFVRGIYIQKNRSIKKDYTLESSLFALFAFGVFEADDPKVVTTMEAVKKGLTVQTQVGGIARYQNDYYFQKSDDIEHIPGNPWIICTLWLADWKIANAKNLKELREAYQDIEWVTKRTMASGVLPEQVDPYTGKPLSVAPLTWSHATFVSTVSNYIEKHNNLSKI